MRKRGIGVLLVAAGIAIGWVLPDVRAEQERASTKTRYFQVIDENDGRKIREQLNSIVLENQSCGVVGTMSPNDWGKTKVILECWR